MKEKNKKTVFVGVSGGVDSSVSALLLKKQGYNVVGVFIRTWTPDFIDCTWRDERRDAMRVCAHLEIPFLECDAEEAYKKGVADYMIEEYKKGRTPNPDVMCNREVKFGVFWDFAKKRGADFIATGHYARQSPLLVEEGVEGGDPNSNHHLALKGTPPQKGGGRIHNLSKGNDKTKDQSYFLWTLRQEDLEHTLFPIGHLKKVEVRILAEKYKIPVATKKDSQGVCFLGPLDMKDFLKHYINKKEGDVLFARHDSELGDEEREVIGSHDGAVFFTLGERHGFKIFQNENNSKPLYVISKDIIKNTITVSPKQGLGLEKSKNYIDLINTNWIIEPQKDKKYQAQIRYHGELLNCMITCIGQTYAEINFEKDVLIDKGQSTVVYDGDICLGGGIVE